jgi:PPM family protein phosphatase
MKWSHGERSDIGRRRRRNEDALVALPAQGVFAVADGMGGHVGGDVASRLAVDALRRAMSANGPLRDDAASAALRAAFDGAAHALAEEAARTPRLAEMGTTLAVVRIAPDGSHALIAHVGDSRVYRLRNDRLELLTRDHTWVQQEVDAGRLTPEQARRHPRAPFLLRVLDAQRSAAPDMTRVDLLAGDTLLLCTDGLSGPLDEFEIAAILALPVPPEDVVCRLIEAANARGGPDNITAIVVRRTD